MSTTIEYNHCYHCTGLDNCHEVHNRKCDVANCKAGKIAARTITESDDGTKTKVQVHAPYVEPEPEEECFYDCFAEPDGACTELCEMADEDCYKAYAKHSERPMPEAVTSTKKYTTHEDIDDLIEETVAQLKQLNNTKGKEYAPEGSDGLANFKNRATQMGITPLQVWGIFYGKHSDSIYSYIKRGEVLSEPIEGRIDDAILYLILLKALIAESA